MSISTTQYLEVAERMRQIYEDAEMRMTDAIAGRAARGYDATGWQAEKLAEVQDVRKELEKAVSDLRHSRGEISAAVQKAYEDAGLRCKTDIAAFTDALGISHINVNTQKVAAILQELNGSVSAMDRVILRQAQDAYSEVIGNASALMATGTVTRQQAVSQALDDFAKRGITGFVDKSGRRWDMTNYAEMATLTAIERATRYGYMDTMQAYGYDLAIISSHAGACELCVAWEDVVISVSGNNHDYPSLSDAEGGGCFHPRCLHDISVYYGDLDRRNGKDHPESVKEPSAAYSARVSQRALERSVRQAKREMRVAQAVGDPQAERKAYAKVRKGQERIRALRNDYNSSTPYSKDWLPRQYSREGGRVVLSPKAKKTR